MPKGYMYILKCTDGSYYTGSTKYIELRLHQHQMGEGANYTKRRLPVELVYFEEFQRIDEAFYREKQVQGWNRKKKKALINGQLEDLPKYAECKNESHYKNASFGSASFDSAQEAGNSSLSVVETSETNLKSNG
jgi:putative endonuclease